jgi:hypothetical protein
MRHLPQAAATATILAFTPAFAAEEKAPKASKVSTDIATAPAGTYVLGKSHASIGINAEFIQQ